MSAELLTAAFFMEGLHEAKPGGYDVIIPAWGKGCIEMVDALISHVPFAIRLCEAAAKANDGMYPGVFDYEVSGPFGRWFGEYILENGGDEPSSAEAQSWLVNEVSTFFTQGLTEVEANAVKEAINSIASE